MIARILEHWLIRGIRAVQADHIRDCQAPFVARDALNNIPGTDLAFALDSEIESAAAALMEALDHAGVPKPDP